MALPHHTLISPAFGHNLTLTLCYRHSAGPDARPSKGAGIGAPPSVCHVETSLKL
jgi:hypothetical protein